MASACATGATQPMVYGRLMNSSGSSAIVSCDCGFLGCVFGLAS